MRITYKTNAAETTKSLTEWYFGKAFVKEATNEALKQFKKAGKTQLKVWQNETGYLTVCIEE